MKASHWVTMVVGLSVAAVHAATSDRAQPHGDLALECTACHSTEQWSPLASPLPFRHDQTGFALTGAHATEVCRGCHQSLVFAFVATTCRDCHGDAHAGELGPDCESCHDTTTWENRRRLFGAHAGSLFPLLAAHATLDCESCHRSQQPFQFATTPVECVGCHLGTYQETTSPNHVSAGFPTDCESCHGAMPKGWRTAVFQHPATFPLGGAHLAAGCEACHPAGTAGTSTACISCHEADFQTARNPDHRLGLPTECQQCHGDLSWAPSTFRHEATAFPLQGAHVALDCATCHGAGFAGTPSACVSCHRVDYDTTRSPQHTAAGFPTSCEACHSQNAWQPATGVDHSLTRFPLEGAHRPLDCAACHSSGFAGTPTACVSCHRDDYDATRNPQHATAGFPTSCEACHSQSAWQPATGIDHNLTRFPLEGAHRSLDCAACHSSGFAGTPTACVSCHRDDYDRAADPSHRAAGFPTTCESCHTAVRWDSSSWNHDALFPIDSGRHRGAWNRCSDCHVNPSSFAVYECINCHAHSRAEMDGEHRGINGYQYLSQACFNCHPRGRE